MKWHSANLFLSELVEKDLIQGNETANSYGMQGKRGFKVE